MKRKAFREKPECPVMYAPFPVEITCPHCGIEIELWSDELETACKICGFLVFRHEKMTN